MPRIQKSEKEYKLPKELKGKLRKVSDPDPVSGGFVRC